jgi:hypothetical protein
MPSVFSTEPGIDTTMLLLPCLTTSASATPLPLTRARMISSAWFNADELTDPPSCDRAVKVTLVPPRRSKPSRGVAGPWSPSKRIPPYMAAITAKSAMIGRHGRGRGVGGAATVSSLLFWPG